MAKRLILNDIPITPSRSPLSHEEQLKQLYLDQKHTLDLFLERGAISQAQYDKSLGDLKSKMQIDTDE